jgi:hypothetical protein
VNQRESVSHRRPLEKSKPIHSFPWSWRSLTLGRGQSEKQSQSTALPGYVRQEIQSRIHAKNAHICAKSFQVFTCFIMFSPVRAYLQPEMSRWSLAFGIWHQASRRSLRTRRLVCETKPTSPKRGRAAVRCPSSVLRQSKPRTVTLGGPVSRERFQYLISFRASISVTALRRNSVLLKQLFDLTASQEVSYRPHRVEPRAKKRRPKKYNLMNKPRVELRAALIRG